MSSSSNRAGGGAGPFQRAFASEVPLCLETAAEEPAARAGGLSGGGARSNKHFVLAPRYSFLPIVAYDTIQYARANYLNNNNSNNVSIWFESNNATLKWHYPLGVLYDMQSEGQTNDNSVFILRIRIRFQDSSSPNVSNSSKTAFPLTLGEDVFHTCKELYFHSMKQSLHLRFGGNPFNKLSESEQDSLWEGIRLKNFNNYIGPIQKMLSQQNSHHCPLRVVIESRMYQPLVDANETLFEALKLVLTDYCLDKQEEQEQEESSIDVDSLSAKLAENFDDFFTMLVNGLLLPPAVARSTPCLAICAELCMQDQFLWVVLLRSKKAIM